MSIVVILLPASILLALVFLGAYLWSVRSGQFDDLHTPALRILTDDQEQDSEQKEQKIEIPKK
jgi:cbb3-type cytochrome oxidase maturation protein